MRSRNYSLFLDDIRHSSEKVIVYTSGMTKDVFLADEKTYDAVLRHLTITGEAVKQIPLKSVCFTPQWNGHRLVDFVMSLCIIISA